MIDTPITRRRAATQARLLEAAAGVFADRGVLAASVEEICDRAGFTRGAFYSNYESKNDLVIALLSRNLETNAAGVMGLDSLQMRAALGGTRTQALQAATSIWLNAQTTNREWILAWAEIKLYAAREPSIRQAYTQFQQAYRREIVNILQPIVAAYGLQMAIPIELGVAMMEPIYQSCMLDALAHMPADNSATVMLLPPALLSQLLAPVSGLLDAWIVGVADNPEA